MLLARLRKQIVEATYADEHSSVVRLIAEPALGPEQRAKVLAGITGAGQSLQARQARQGHAVLFPEEFGLSNKEGVALMCLAEALLRVPDTRTADRLISEKILSGNWGDHQGKSDSGVRERLNLGK